MLLVVCYCLYSNIFSLSILYYNQITLVISFLTVIIDNDCGVKVITGINPDICTMFTAVTEVDSGIITYMMVDCLQQTHLYQQELTKLY